MGLIIIRSALILFVSLFLTNALANDSICADMANAGDPIDDNDLCDAADEALRILKQFAEKGGDTAHEIISKRVDAITPDAQDAKPLGRKDNSFFDSPIVKAINENLMIRQSVSDKNELAEPARATLTLPDEGDDTYAVDIGIAYQVDLFALEDWYFSPTFEYHRNSAEKARASTTEAGLTLTWSAGDIYGQHGVGRKGRDTFAALTDFSLKYKLDDEKSTDSFRVEVLNSPLYKPIGLNLPVRRGDGTLGWWGFDFQWGFDYEENVDGKMATKDGDTSRVTSKLHLHLFPFAKDLMRRVEVVVGMQIWEELHQTGFYDDESDGFSMLDLSIRYYFDSNERLSVSAAYTKGDNPVQGKFDQDFFLIGLNFKTDVEY